MLYSYIYEHIVKTNTTYINIYTRNESVFARK